MTLVIIQDYTASNYLKVNNELEKIWKWSWPNLKYYLESAWKDWRTSRKTSARMVSVLVEIQTGKIPNTSQKHYCLSQPAQWRISSHTNTLNNKYHEVVTQQQKENEVPPP
jgi:hypothetical protein